METDVDTPKGLPTLAVAEIPFDVRQNMHKRTLHPGKLNKKTVDAGRRPNHGN
jgi:hypothetical protein